MPWLCDMDSDDEEGGEDEVSETKQSDGPSCWSDRRIIHLLIDRNWVDNIIERSECCENDIIRYIVTKLHATSNKNNS